MDDDFGQPSHASQLRASLMDQVVKVFESIIKTDESITMQDQLPLQFIGHGVVLFFEKSRCVGFSKTTRFEKNTASNPL